MIKCQKKSNIWYCHCYGTGMLYSNRLVLAGVASTILLALPVAKATPTIVGTVQLDTESGVYPGLGGGEFTAYTSQNYVQADLKPFASRPASILLLETPITIH
jgi:hypothetical protein